MEPKIVRHVMGLLSQIERCWRILMTGMCFALFGVGGLLLSFVLIPLIMLFTRSTRQRELKVQRLIQISFHFFCQTMKVLGVLDYRIDGIEALRRDSGCLIIANHPSLIDYVLIASVLPQCDCLVKAAIWSNPFIMKIVKAAGYIPNRAPDDLIEQCAQRLQQGNKLLIFPEGTRTTVGVKNKIQRGAAQIAIRTQSDLRLIHIRVSPSFLMKTQKWYQVPSKKPFFHLEVKGKIPVTPFINESNNATLAARQLNQHIAERLIPSEINV